jgi:hypothetical protein
MEPNPGPDEGTTLFWGDLHKHLTGADIDATQLDRVVEDAKTHLDFSTVLCYPFKWYRTGLDPGIREESVGHDPDFDDWWERIQSVSRRHNDPQSFVTFPAYEWHGDRRRWGDHNVIYREEGHPIDDRAAFPELCDALRDRPALAIPHHTAYQPRERAKDWSAHDAALSPVMEVYSSHGSSEGVATPIGMDDNPSMGPRTSGGTFQDALDRGHHLGVVASNDGPGLPGTWGKGLAGVWASELTREALWEAITARRTIGVTGDRIRLWWDIDGTPLGSSVTGPAETATVDVDAPLPLDRIDLLEDGQLVDRYSHLPATRAPDAGRYRCLVEMGWGPTDHYGDFESLRQEWEGTLGVNGGELHRVVPRFVGYGQDVSAVADDAVAFECVTTRGDQELTLPEGAVDQTRQGFVLEFSGTASTTIVLDLEEVTIDTSLAEAREGGHLYPLVEESEDRIEESFEVTPEDFDNLDPVYHNARKVKVHPAHPIEACRTRTSFDLSTRDADACYYVRAFQVDGQAAWASPIWID